MVMLEKGEVVIRRHKSKRSKMSGSDRFGRSTVKGKKFLDQLGGLIETCRNKLNMHIPTLE